MPKTKIATWSEKRKAIAAKKRATHARKVENLSLTTSDWKRFCDVVFEARIRWRDGWKSVVSGRSYPWDYEHIHGGHYISRGKLPTRYDEMNCHAITSQENYQQSLGNKEEITKYTAFMIRKYGQSAVDDLEQRSKVVEQWNWSKWIDIATELYNKALAFDERATVDRLGMTYRTIKEQKILNLILTKIKDNE